MHRPKFVKPTLEAHNRHYNPKRSNRRYSALRLNPSALAAWLTFPLYRASAFLIRNSSTSSRLISSSLADPRAEGVTEFLASLLAPARSGAIVTANDLARAARELELGLRYGERRYVLEAFFAQDPHRVLNWLAAEAERWAALHRSSLLPAGAREHWTERARSSAALLRSLAQTTLEIRAT